MARQGEAGCAVWRPKLTTQAACLRVTPIRILKSELREARITVGTSAGKIARQRSSRP